MSKFDVGMKFSSFVDVENELKRYCEENFHEFWKRDARLLGSSKLKKTENANPDLKYYTLKLCCIKGGRTFQKKKGATGERDTKTWREDCPAFILLTLSRDRQFLEVMSVNLCHNHEASEVLYKMLPQQRRLPEDAQKEAATLLQLGVNKKSLAQKLSVENNRSVLLKDLSNMASKLKKSSAEDLNSIVETLQNTYCCSVNVLHKDNILEGLFFQDERMHKQFQRFPEIIFFDGTYKLTNIGFVCYIFMVEDSNGSSEVVGAGLMAREDRASVDWLVDAFKEKNDSTKTRAIMTDKDFLERAVFKEKFPNAALLICLFHTLRTFKREITCEKYGLTEALKLNLKEYLQQLAYSYTEEQYTKIYLEFSSVAPASVMAYYDKNWHPIRKEWTRMACTVGNYLNSTNNRLECFNSKLKSVIKCHSSLSVFFEKFFVLLHCVRSERDSETVQAIQKVPTNPLVPGSTEELYAKLLTPYAFKFLKKQLETSGGNTVQKISDGNYNYNCEGRNFPTNYNACSCAFFLSMKLPCRHILATRHDMGLHLYDEDLCDGRWKLKNLASSRIPATRINSRPRPLEVTSKAAVNPKTQHQRYRAASQLTAELTQIISEASGSLFEMKMEQISELISYWKNGKEVALVSVETASNTGTPSLSAASPYERESEEHLLPSTSCSNVSVQSHDIIQSTEDVADIFCDSVSTINSPRASLHESRPKRHLQPSTSGFCVTDQSNVIVEYPENEIDLFNEFARINSPDDSSKASSPVSPSCSSIMIPPASKKRGRARGFDSTVIGLPKKKRCTRPVAFSKLPLLLKQKKMLLWFVDEDVSNRAVNSGVLIDESQVEAIPENVPNCCIEEGINMNLINQFFSDDAWKLVQSVVSVKNQMSVWLCDVCILSCRDDSVFCDSCLKWIHFTCAGLSKPPAHTLWFCRKCSGQ